MTGMSETMRQAAQAAAKREMLMGVLWLGGGGIVTLITYSAASSGGAYAVFWGAIAYGGFRLLRGIYYWLNPEALIKKL